MNIGERLRLLRARFELSQAEASVKFGIPSGSWKKYETGPSEPGSGALRALSEGGVNVNWLLTGEGEMLLSDREDKVKSPSMSTIDTVEFMRVFDRLLEEDFLGSNFSKSHLAYFTALVYSRVASEPEDKRDIAIEACISQLNMLVDENWVTNSAQRLLQHLKSKTQDPDELQMIVKDVEETTTSLTRIKDKFRGRLLSPGSKLESEFLSGVDLSKEVREAVSSK